VGGDISSGFETHLRGRGFSPKTVAVYLGAVRRFARWWEETTSENFDLAAVTPLDVADYRRHLLNRGRKAGTVNTALEILRCFFGWLKKGKIFQPLTTYEFVGGVGVMMIKDLVGYASWAEGATARVQ
jgi:integrase/recombinase XerC